MFNEQDSLLTKNQTETAKPESVSAQELQRAQSEFEGKIARLREWGIKFDDSTFYTFKENQKTINAQSAEVVEEYYSYFEKMNMEIENFTKYNEAELGIMKSAQFALDQAVSRLNASQEKVKALEEKPTGGLVNGVVNLFTNLKGKKAAAQTELAKAKANEELCRNGIPQAAENAEKQRRARVASMTADQFLQELTAVTAKLREKKVKEQKETGERMKETHKATEENKKTIATLTTTQDELKEKIEKKEAEITDAAGKLSEIADQSSTEYIEKEVKLDEQRTDLEKLKGQQNAIIGELTARRTQSLEYGAQQKQLSQQYNTLDLAIRVLDAQVVYNATLIPNLIRTKKNADYIELFANQNQTNNQMDENAMKTIIESGIVSQVTVEKTYHEQAKHDSTIKDILTQGNKAFDANAQRIEAAKKALEEKTKRGGLANSADSDYNPNATS